MTERKPPGMSFESWAERQIREAQERGAFDDLPGAGKPLPDLDRPFSTERWVVDWARREGLETEPMLPEPLLLRKEIERLPDAVRDLESEEEVKAVVRDLNRRIAVWIRRPSGPRVVVAPVDQDRVVEQWRASRRTDPGRPAAPPDRTATGATPTRRRRWWNRPFRRHPR
ncbi:MAG TPA: DUF1992 domain-containing protein [Streptosporangiaceae bacterium]